MGLGCVYRVMRGLLVGCCLLFAAAAVHAQEPAWQTAAGGKMAFDVATVRLSVPGAYTQPSFPLSADDSFKNTGGDFVADFPLDIYIRFAYKLPASPEQAKAIAAQMPKEASDVRFTVHAKGPATATKDQMRLMVQDLLRERFGLKAHFETREIATMDLMAKKPGVTGPKLRPHAEGPKCAEEGGAETAEGVFPAVCGLYASRVTPEHQALIGSRNTTLDLMAAQLFSQSGLGKMVVDRTGLIGRWDFTLEYMPEVWRSVATAQGTSTQGTTLLEAVDEQLGLKLKPGKAMLPVLVVDHVEMPSSN